MSMGTASISQPTDEHGKSHQVAMRSTALVAFACQAGGQAAAWLATGALTHLSSRNTFGQYVWATSASTFLAVPVCLGMPMSMIRFLPGYRESRDWSRFHGLLITAMTIGFGLGAILALIGTLFVSVGLHLSIPISSHALLITLWMVPIVAASMIITQAHRMLIGTQALALPNLLVPVLMVAFVLISHLAHVKFNAVLVISISLAATALTLLAQTACFELDFRKLGSAGEKPRREWVREWLKPALPIAATSSLQMLLGQLDILIAGLLLPTALLAVYGLASRLSRVTAFALYSAQTAIGPQLALATQRRDPHIVRTIFLLGTKWTLVPALAISGILLVAGHRILAFFGHGYESAYVPMLILTAGFLVNIACGPVLLYLNISGNERKVPAVSLATLIIETALILGLDRSYGAIGIAAGASLAMAIGNIRLFLIATKALKNLTVVSEEVPAPGTAG